VVGVNLFARAPLHIESASPDDSWIGRLRRAASRIGGKKTDTTIGAKAPDFDLPMHNGSGQYRLSAQRGQHVLLMFLPSDWCPVCQACLRVYRNNAPVLRRNGVQMAIVTTAVTDEVLAFARGVELDHAILIDTDSKVARDFGAARVVPKTGDVRLLPISFFIDQDGIVRRRSELDTMSLCVEDFEELLSH
jgi:peroxiredoxin